jgi:hypothetical protein
VFDQAQTLEFESDRAQISEFEFNRVYRKNSSVTVLLVIPYNLIKLSVVITNNTLLLKSGDIIANI